MITEPGTRKSPAQHSCSCDPQGKFVPCPVCDFQGRSRCVPREICRVCELNVGDAEGLHLVPIDEGESVYLNGEHVGTVERGKHETSGGLVVTRWGWQRAGTQGRIGNKRNIREGIKALLKDHRESTKAVSA